MTFIDFETSLFFVKLNCINIGAMGIKIFNIDFDSLGSMVCAITSIAIIILALAALLHYGEDILKAVLSIF